MLLCQVSNLDPEAKPAEKHYFHHINSHAFPRSHVQGICECAFWCVYACECMLVFMHQPLLWQWRVSFLLFLSYLHCNRGDALKMCSGAGCLFKQSHHRPKPHRAPVALGMKDASTPFWDLQCFRQNWNNCMKQQWIWITDGCVCKCLCNKNTCSICLHIKGIDQSKVIILASFTHLHVAPEWIFVNNDFSSVWFLTVSYCMVS